MTQPPLARTGPGGRHYIWPPGDNPDHIIPSVTTILNEIAKPALTYWAAREVAAYAYEIRGQLGELERAAAIDLLKRAPYRTTTAAGDRGTAAHAAIEAWLARRETGREPPTIDLDSAPYVAAALDFLEQKVDGVLHTEATIYNLSLQYAGTADLIATLADGRTAVIDWKTGKRIYPEVGLQLQAYAAGEFIGHPDGTTTNMPPCDVGIAVRITDTPAWEAKEVTFTPRLMRTFTALRTVTHWRQHIEPAPFTASYEGAPTDADHPTD